MIVTILGVPYQVSAMTEIKDVCHNRSGSDLYGQISYIQRSIRLWDNGCPAQMRQTLLHEILHGVIEGLKIRELMDSDGSHLEIPIDQLATGLALALESMGASPPLPSD